MLVVNLLHGTDIQIEALLLSLLVVADAHVVLAVHFAVHTEQTLKSTD